jgi:putative ABC transport system permease protein
VYLFAVLWITVKRMLHNWKVVGALLCGLVLAAGIMAAIPTYSAGALQASFTREWLAGDTFRPPFTVIVSHENQRRELDVKYRDLERMEEELRRDLPRRVFQQPLALADFASLGGCALLPPDDTDPTVSSPNGEIARMSNLQSLADIIQGRWYAPRGDGVVEIVVDESTLERNGLAVGVRLTAWYSLQSGEEAAATVNGAVAIPIEIVGVFRAKPGITTKEWIYPPPYSDRGFVHPDVFRSELTARGLRLEKFDLQWVFDSPRVQVATLDDLIAGLEAVEKHAAQLVPGTRFWLSPLEFFRAFSAKARNVSLFLSALAVPVIGVIVYYIVLMAGVSVQHRAKEVVVLHSRGAGRLQTVASFFLEWLLLGGVAAAAGPYVGALITRALGASSGFLSFVDREAIPAVIGTRARLFALAASALAVAAGMGPVFATFRHTVATFSRRPERRKRVSLWHRLYLDVIFLALSIFGYRELMWQSTGLQADQTIPADPVLFFLPVLFLLGAGLLLLRIYPYLLTLLRLAVGRLSGVVWQLTLRRMTRDALQYFPLLLLLVLTLSLGVYSAFMARTLSRNFDDRIRFEVGADLAMKEEWHAPGAPASGRSTSEPPFLKRLELPGVASAARVLKGKVEVTVGGTWETATAGTMMAVSPGEFARTAWFRADMGKARATRYLGLLARHREGALVSQGFLEEQKLSIGDPLRLTYEDQPIDAYVAGALAYWPTLDPESGPFFILDIDRVLESIRLEPYEVWYRLRSHDQVQELVDALPLLGVYPTQVRDAEAMIAAFRREPYRMGFFGILSLGFIVCCLVTVLGFLVATYFSMRSRLVQWSALRAMGLSGLQLAAILSLEQLFTLGAGLAAGAGLGSLSSKLFIPFLRARVSELRAVPPFLLVVDRSDVLSAVAVLAALFVAAVAGLSVILARMRLSHALKLGEEAGP